MSGAGPNAERGEATIELDGREWVLRPTFEAIQAIEKGTGRSLVELATGNVQGGLTTRETALIVTLLIRAWGKAEGDDIAARVNEARVGQLIYASEGGYMLAAVKLMALLPRALRGGYDAEGKALPGRETRTSAPSSGA